MFVEHMHNRKAQHTMLSAAEEEREAVSARQCKKLCNYRDVKISR